jgi:hypothetical protein
VLRELLSEDHARLDALLATCLRAEGAFPSEAYDEFRRGLLRHIGIEERILFPELRKHQGVTELERQLHRDHAALAALLVPPPTRRELEQIAAILDAHNPLEEVEPGLYEIIERATGEELPTLMERVRAYPQVPLAAHSDSELLRTTIEKLLREAEEGRQAARFAKR